MILYCVAIVIVFVGLTLFFVLNNLKNKRRYKKFCEEQKLKMQQVEKEIEQEEKENYVDAQLENFSLEESNLEEKNKTKSRFFPFSQNFRHEENELNKKADEYKKFLRKNLKLDDEEQDEYEQDDNQDDEEFEQDFEDKYDENDYDEDDGQDYDDLEKYYKNMKNHKFDDFLHNDKDFEPDDLFDDFDDESDSDIDEENENDYRDESKRKTGNFDFDEIKDLDLKEIDKMLKAYPPNVRSVLFDEIMKRRNFDDED